MTSRSLDACCRVVERLPDPMGALADVSKALLEFVKTVRNPPLRPWLLRKLDRERATIARQEERRLADEKRRADRRAARGVNRSWGLPGGSSDAEFRDFDDDVEADLARTLLFFDI